MLKHACFNVENVFTGLVELAVIKTKDIQFTSTLKHRKAANPHI